MFSELSNLIQKEVVYSIYKISFAQKIAPTLMQTAPLSFSAPEKTMDKGKADRWGPSAISREAATKRQDAIPVKVRDASGHKVGRNDPCPCGSGKKFKKCCGK